MYLSNWVRGVFFFVSVKTGSRCVGCVVFFFFFLSFIHGTFLVLARWVATRIGPMRRSGRLESS